MSFTTSALDSGLSASRDISPDPLCSSFLVLQPMLSFGINCAKLIALFCNFKALEDFTKKMEANPSFSWELFPKAGAWNDLLSSGCFSPSSRADHRQK